MTTPTPPSLPPGMFDPVEPDMRAPIIDKDFLKDPVLVKFTQTRSIKGKDGQMRAIHQFVTDAGVGQRFEIWGTAELNSQLAKVPSLSIVLLQYMGMRSDGNQVSSHIWTVQVARVGGAKLQDVVAMYHAHAVRLHGTIEATAFEEAVRLRARNAERDARMSSGPGAPNAPTPTDDDFPGALQDDDLPF